MWSRSRLVTVEEGAEVEPIQMRLDDLWIIEFLLSEERGNSVISEIHIFPAKEKTPERGITREILRSVDPKRLQNEARKFREEILESEGLDPVESPAWAFVKPPPRHTQGRRRTERSLVLAALAAYVHDGSARTDEVAGELHVSAKTVDRHLRTAVEEGYLPTTTQGRRRGGLVVGPKQVGSAGRGLVAEG